MTESILFIMAYALHNEVTKVEKIFEQLVSIKKESRRMISLIIWIILGFLAGYLAKAIMPGPDGGGFILTTILGIVGAVVGGFIGSLIGFPMVSSFDNIGGSIPSFIFSIIGAIVVLAVYRLATGRSVRG